MSGERWSRSDCGKNYLRWDLQNHNRDRIGLYRDTISPYLSKQGSTSPKDVGRKLHRLVPHLVDLRGDSQQMFQRILEVENLIKELDPDNRLNYGTDRRDAGYEKQDKQVNRLKQELRYLRLELDELRNTQNRSAVRDDDGDDVDDDDDDDDCIDSRERRFHKEKHYHHCHMASDDELTEWASNQLADHRHRDYRDYSPCNHSLPSPLHQCSAERTSPIKFGYTGFRSVSPRPISTQHNQHRCSPAKNQLNSFNTSNRRTFVPKAAADLSMGDGVKFQKRVGAAEFSTGKVKYIGHLPGKTGAYIGVELAHEIGKHNGEFRGYRYFQCKPNRGLFIPFDRIVHAWPNDYM